MIKYLSLEHVEKSVIPIIHKHYARENNPAHNYFKESDALEKLEGCLERVQWDYIQGIIPKATQLFLCINKGHFFENGNKRLALVVLLSFLLDNGYGFRDNLDKREYVTFMEELFPGFEDFDGEGDFTSIEFAYYNLTIIVADSGRYKLSHDELKERVERFLKYSTVTSEEIAEYGDLYMDYRDREK